MTPLPRVFVVIDPDAAIRFPALINVQIRGKSKRLCDSLKMILNKYSQNVLRALKSNVIMEGPTLILKLLMNQDYFERLTEATIAGIDVLTCLKCKHSADLIFVPTLQIFSHANESLRQIY